MRRPLVGERLGDLRHATLRGGVAGHRNAALKRQHRRDVHDLSAVAALQHVHAGRTAQEEHARQVHLDRFVPHLVGMLCGGRPLHRCRVVHEDIDPPKRLENRGNEPQRFVPIREVRRKTASLSALCLDCGFGGRRRLCARVNGNVGAGIGKRERHPRAESARRARHQRNLPAQIEQAV